MAKLEQAVKDLQDNLVVIAEIEKRQSALLQEHGEMLHGLNKTVLAQSKVLTAQSNAALSYIEHVSQQRREIERLDTEAAAFRRRTDQNLAEITDKLNGLIGYVAGIKPPPPAH